MKTWKSVKVGDRLLCVADPETSKLSVSFENWAKIEGIEKGKTYTVLVVDPSGNPGIKIDGSCIPHLWLLKDQAPLFRKVRQKKPNPAKTGV